MPDNFILRDAEDIITGRTHKVKADPEEAGEGTLKTLHPTTVIALRKLEQNEKLSWVKVAQIRLPNDRLVFAIETDRDDPEMEIDHDAIYTGDHAKVRAPEKDEEVSFMTEVTGTEREGTSGKIRREDFCSPNVRDRYNQLKNALHDRLSPEQRRSLQ